MAELAVNNLTGNDCNMSRLSSEQSLEVNCWNGTSTRPAASDRLAQGISLSTPIIMTTFGVLGNILALIVLYASRREAQARRTVFFVMLSGLAWTDLLGLLAVSPIAIITYANNLSWVGGVALCHYHGFMMVSFGIVMPLIVCCMSVERFLAIKFSYYYARHITRKKAQLIFLACWAVTTSFTTMPFVGFGSYQRQYPGTWCFLNFHRQSTVDTIYAALFSSLNIIAIVIMILCNLVVAGTLFRLRLRRRLHSSPSIDRKLSVSGMGSSTSGTVIRQKHHSDMEAQMIWFLGLITIAFSVCWLPLNVHILIMQFTGTTNQVLDLQFIRMVSCNQILDPWLYVIFRKNSVLRIIRQLKACCFGSKEPVKVSLVKPPSMRYNMSNKSFFCEATTVGRTFVGENRRNNVRLLDGDSVKNGDQKVNENNWAGGSSDSLTLRLSICPSCDGECCSERYSSQMSDSPQGLSMSVLPVNKSRCVSSANVRDCDAHKYGIGHYEAESVHNELTSPYSLQLESQISSPHATHDNLLGKQDRYKNKVNGGSSSSDPIYRMSPTSINNVYTQQVALITPTHSTSLSEAVNSWPGACLQVPLTEIRLQPGKQSLDHYLLLSPPLASPEQLIDTLSENHSRDNLFTNLQIGSTCIIPANIPSSLDSEYALKAKCYITSDIVNKGEVNETSIASFIFSPNFTASSCKHLSQNGNAISDNITVSCPELKTRLIDKSTKNAHFGYYKHKSPRKTVAFQEDESNCLLSPDSYFPLTVKSVLFPSNNCALAQSDTTNQSRKGLVLDLDRENKLGTSKCFLQGTEHTDQIACLKTQKTPLLARNGTACHRKGINIRFNDCVGGMLELSVGNHT